MFEKRKMSLAHRQLNVLCKLYNMHENDLFDTFMSSVINPFDSRGASRRLSSRQRARKILVFGLKWGNNTNGSNDWSFVSYKIIGKLFGIDLE